MNKPYHERPDWILKSIVYFCDNYTIDKNDLSKKKKSAIATYREPKVAWLGLDESIMQRLDWDESPQGFNFWDCLWYLMTSAIPNAKAVLCDPWTEAEKRKIDKMPRVK